MQSSFARPVLELLLGVIDREMAVFRPCIRWDLNPKPSAPEADALSS